MGKCDGEGKKGEHGFLGRRRGVDALKSRPTVISKNRRLCGVGYQSILRFFSRLHKRRNNRGFGKRMGSPPVEPLQGPVPQLGLWGRSLP